jgi:hypothetical protein
MLIVHYFQKTSLSRFLVKFNEDVASVGNEPLSAKWVVGLEYFYSFCVCFAEHSPTYAFIQESIYKPDFN